MKACTSRFSEVFYLYWSGFLIYKGKEMDKVVGDVAVLDDGTCWRLPRSERDLIWRCTWAQETITKEDFLVIASYLSVYRYMIEGMTQKDRNTTCEKIKKLMKEVDSGYTKTDS